MSGYPDTRGSVFQTKENGMTQLGPDGIKRIGVVGAGTIGASWAAYFITRGLEVVVFDPQPGVRTGLADRIAAMAAQLPPLPDVAIGKVVIAAQLEDLADVDFVQENGPEREDLKIDLYRQLESVIRPEVMVASSSSGLLIGRLQAHCRHPERFLIGHPFNPPHLMPLVEVVSGATTGVEQATPAMEIYAAIGKRPIHLKKEVPGHIANRLQAAVLREAVHLVLEGVASVGDVDAAMVYGPGMRWAGMGPALTFHLAGGAGGMAAFIEHLGGPVQSWWDDLGRPDLTPEAIAALIDGVEAAYGQFSITELQNERDQFLHQIASVKRPAE